MLLRLLHLLAAIAITAAVFVDEAYKVDWAIEYLGRIKNVEYEDEVVVISSDPFTTGLNASTGAVIWRKPVRSDKAFLLKTTGVDVGSFVVADGNYVSSYGSLGALEWEAFVSSPITGVSKLSEKKTILVAREDGFVTKLDSLFGTIGWNKPLPTGTIVGSIDSGFLVEEAGKLSQITFDNEGTYTTESYGKCSFIGSFEDVVVCQDSLGVVISNKDGKTVLDDASKLLIDPGRQLLIQQHEDSEEALFWRIGEGLIEEKSRLIDVTSYSYRATSDGGLLVIGSDEIKLIDEAGILWSRPYLEISDVLFLDLEEAEVEAELLYEENNGLVQGFLGRIKRHLSGKSLFEGAASSSSMENILSKVLVFVTDDDHLYATNIDGEFIWKLDSLEGPFTVGADNKIHSKEYVIDAHGVAEKKFSIQPIDYEVDYDDDKVFGVYGGQTWTYGIDGYQVAAVATRDEDDFSASIGTILPDRRVLYKYLHRGAVATVLVSEDGSARVALLDKASGRILHGKQHTGIHPGSVQLVFGEYWIVYTFDSDVGPQLVVWDLFESQVPNERTFVFENYTSFGDFPAPSVRSKAFFISNHVEALGVSKTRFGITSRDVVVSFDNGQIVSVPKRVLDPQTGSRESNVLLIDPAFVISHQRQLYVSGIKSTGTLLESTSLIVGYGLDVFFTRTTPSQPFDMLTASFSKVSLINTVIVLAMVLVFLRPMVQKRALTANWQ